MFRTHVRPLRDRRQALTFVTVMAAIAATLVSGISTAAATTQRLCALMDVPESSTSVYVKTLQPYETLTLTPGGRIWAGVWFTGANGPEGWNAIAPSYYPLPGARQYSLLGRLSGQSWQYIGASPRTFYNNSPYSRPLYARVNDNTAGNGSGAFTLTFCYYIG